MFPATKSPRASHRYLPIPNGATDGTEQHRRPVDPLLSAAGQVPGKGSRQGRRHSRPYGSRESFMLPVQVIADATYGGLCQPRRAKPDLRSPGPSSCAARLPRNACSSCSSNMYSIIFVFLYIVTYYTSIITYLSCGQQINRRTSHPTHGLIHYVDYRLYCITHGIVKDHRKNPRPDCSGRGPGHGTGEGGESVPRRPLSIRGNHSWRSLPDHGADYPYRSSRLYQYMDMASIMPHTQLDLVAHPTGIYKCNQLNLQ